MQQCGRKCSELYYSKRIPAQKSVSKKCIKEIEMGKTREMYM